MCIDWYLKKKLIALNASVVLRGGMQLRSRGVHGEAAG